MKAYKNKLQKGFTLIELMIVVAVIGVLAAIAVPQYQNYVAKSELGAGLASVTSVRTNVENYVVTNGAFPDGTTNDQKPEDLGVVQPGNADITFVKNKEQILLTFKTAGNSPDINTAKLALVRVNGSWSCKTTVTKKDLLPKSCTTDASI